MPAQMEAKLKFCLFLPPSDVLGFKRFGIQAFSGVFFRALPWLLVKGLM
jgi:hypothetical protein